MRFITWVFWPLTVVMDAIEREIWLRECAEFDELRGFSLRDQVQEAERWETHIKVRPAES